MATLTVQDTSLTKMADALRAGTGTTEPLTFPEEFVSQINILAAIGGGGMITPEDIGAARADHTHTAEDIGAAKVDHTHTPASIGAAQEEHTHSATDIRGIAENNFVVGSGNGLVGKSPEEVREVLNIPTSGEVLWEGSWTSGTITVPNTDKYKMFILSFSGLGTTIIAVKHGIYIRGVGGYSTATPTITYYQFAATFEDGVWTFVAANSMQHKPDNDHGATGNITLTQIYGLI